jgi:hypothetical protein
LENTKNGKKLTKKGRRRKRLAPFNSLGLKKMDIVPEEKTDGNI